MQLCITPDGSHVYIVDKYQKWSGMRLQAMVWDTDELEPCSNLVSQDQFLKGYKPVENVSKIRIIESNKTMLIFERDKDT